MDFLNQLNPEVLFPALTLAARTDVSLPPVPTTPGAIITPDGLICLPPDEAGALLLWMEYAESNGSL